MQREQIIDRVRLEIGDPLQPFMTSSLGDGMTAVYDLPKQNIDTSQFSAYIINGANTQTLNQYTDYTIDADLGIITLNIPVPNSATLVMQGMAWGMFTDTDLSIYIDDSVRQHTNNRFISERIRTRQGFIAYRNMPMDLTNLPDIEEPLLVMLTTLNVMWVLANDAATDANIQTAEGTNIDRVSRYRQLMDHIRDLQERYERYCGQLNVGAFRMENLQFRRISRTTGRLVPIFLPREYDDHTWPVRELPPIDQHNADDSGIPSPLWNASGY